MFFSDVASTVRTSATGWIKITGTGYGSQQGVESAHDSNLFSAGSGAVPGVAGRTGLWISGTGGATGEGANLRGTFEATSGDVSLTGTTGGTASISSGLWLEDSSQIRTLTSGSIYLTGVSANAGADNDGVALQSTTISAAGTGNIAIDGTGSSTYDGVYVSGSKTATLTTAGGNISLIGRGSSFALNEYTNSVLIANATAGGTVSLTAVAGVINLGNSGNDFTGAVVISAVSDATITDTNALALGTSSISGNLALTTDGALTQSGALAVTGTTDITAGSANHITLSHASNNFTGGVRVVSGNTVSGNLTVAASGAITQASVLNVSGTTSLAAGSANAITLANTSNDFGGAVSIVSAAAVNLLDTNALVLGTASLSSLVAQAGAGGGTPGAGNLALSGIITASLAGANANAVVLATGTGSSAFINNAGTNAITLTGATSPRWLVYVNDPYTAGNGDVLGGLKSYNNGVFENVYTGYTGTAYAPGSVTETGNRYIIRAASQMVSATTVTVSTLSNNKVYGETLALANSGYTLSYSAGSVTFPEFSETKPAWIDATAATLSSGGTVATATVTGGTSGGNLYPITVSGLVNTDSANKTLVIYNNGNVTITPRPLTLTPTAGTAQSREYDGTTTATFSVTPIFSLTNIVNSDSVSLTGTATGLFADKNVGTAKTVSLSGLTSSNANYSVVTVPSLSADITARTLTLSATATDKIYDQANTATVTGLSGDRKVSGDDLSYTSSSATFASANVARNGSNAVIAQTVTVAGLGLSGADAANYSLTSTSATTNATISPVELTLTGASGSMAYNGGTSFAAPTYSFSGTLGGDTVTVSGAASFDTRHVGTGKLLTASLSGLTLGGAQGGNYALGSGSYAGSGDITAKIVTLTLGAISKTYDASSAYTLQAADLSTLTTALGASGDSVTAGAVTYSANANAGTNKTVTLDAVTVGDGNSGANFSITLAGNGTSTITQKALTISGSTADSKVYDGNTTAAVNSGTLTGFVGIETVGMTGAGTFSDKNVGTGKAVTAAYTLSDGTNGGLAANYSLANDALTASVTAKTLTITGSAASNKTYDGITSATVSASADNLVGLVGAEALGVSAAGSFDDKNVGTGKAVTAAYTLSNGAGGLAANYTLADASLTADITAAALTVTAPTVTKTYDGTTSASGTATMGALAGVGAGETAGSVSIAFTDADANASSGNKTVRPSGLVIRDSGNADVTSNYSITYTDNTGSTINKYATTLSGTRAYDGTNAVAGSMLIFGTLVGIETLAASGSGTVADVNVGSGKTVTAGSLALADGTGSASNYSFTVSPVSITQLATANWKANTTGDWFTADNWVEGAVPTLSNVAGVVIPSTGVASFNNSGSAVQLTSLNSSGALNVTTGTLNVGSSFVSADYSQSGGSVTGSGGFTVSNSFNQSGGSLSITDALNITQASGTLTLGALSAGSLALAGSANVVQGGAITTSLLSANMTSGSLALNSASNVIAKLGSITAPCGFALTNDNTALIVDGNLSTTNTAISIDTGTATYTHNADRDFASGSGNITITADNVALAANTGNNAFTSTGTLTLQPKTAGKAVSLGGGAASGAWGLSNAEIGYFTTGQAGAIVIGRSDSSGVLTMDDSANFTGRNVTLNAGTIWQSTGKVLTADTVQLNAVTSGTGQGATDGRIGTTFTYFSVAANRLGVSTNNARAFVKTGGATSITGATLGTSALYLVLGGGLTQDGAITAQSLSLNGISLGNVALTHAGNNIDILGAQLFTGSSLNYADSDGFATGAIANGRTGAVASKGVTLSAGGAGNLVLGVSGSGSVDAGTSMVTLSSGTGNITQTAPITGGSLKVTTSGAGGVTLDNINNNVSTLAGVAGSGGFSYSSYAALTVGMVDGINGIDTSVGNGAISITESAARSLAITGNLAVGSSMVSLLGGSAIAATGRIQAGSLRVAGGAATLTNVANHIGTLVASMSNKNLTYVDSGSFTVGTVGASTGISTGTGALTLTAGGVGSKITVNNAVTSWGSTFTADDFDASATINAQGGVLWLRPTTAGRAIDLGTDTAGTLGISATDFSKLITTGGIKIGRNAADGTASGALTLSSALNSPAGTPLTLSTGGAISTTGSGALISSGTALLSVNGNDSIALGGANDWSHVNLYSTGVGKTISYNDINNITTYNLIAKGNVAVTAAGNITAQSGSSLINGVLTLTSSGGGNITQGTSGISATALEANTSAANGAITLNSTSRELVVSQPLSAGTSNISLSGSFITATAAPITGGGLSLLGRSGNLTINHAGNDIATLAASLLYANSILNFVDSNAFTVGTVGSMSGIVTKGEIKLTATAAGSLLNVTQAISNGNTATGVSLLADDFDASAAINAGSGTLWLSPATAGRQIDLGSNTADKLGISATDFAQMASTGTIMLGNSSGSASAGALVISNAISRTGRLSLRTAGGITQSAALTATTLEIVAKDSVTLTNAANNTDSLVMDISGNSKSGAWTDADGVTITGINNSGTTNSVAVTAAANGGSGNLTLAGSIGSGTVSLINAGTGNLVLNTGSKIYASANGNGGTSNTVVLAAGTGSGAFINNAGSGVLSLSGTNSPRWLVYANSPDTPSYLNKLSSGSEAIFAKTYASYAPGSVTEAGNRYLFASAAPTNSGSTITFTSIDASKIYGDVSTLGSANYKWFAYSNGGTARPEFSTPLNPGVTLTGTPTVTSAGSAGTANVGSYGVSLDLTGVSVAGYTLVANNTGLLGVTQRAVTIDSATAANKVYDGTTAATLGSFVLGNVVNGNTVTVSTPMSASFADKNVGTGKTVTSTLGTGALSNSNYMLPSDGIGTFSANITARALALTLTAADRVYDGTTGATATVTGDNRIAGDDLSYSVGSTAFANKNVGAGKTATVSGIALTGGLDLGNYSLANSATTTAAITQATLVVDSATGSKTYDGTTALATPTWTLSGLFGSDAVTASGAANFLDKNVGTGKLLTASLAALTLADTDAGNYTLGTGTFTGGSGTITPRSLTVSATGVNKVYDATTAATATLSSDKVAGDDLAFSYTPLAFANKNVGTGKALSLTGITLAGGADAGNYTLAGTTASTTANITAASLSLAMISGSKVYDGDAVLSAPTFGLTGVLGSDGVAVSGAANFSDKNAGTGKTLSVDLGTLTVGGADGGNYVLGAGTWNGGSGTITPKTITYSGGTGIDKTYDGTTTVASGYTLGSLTGIVGADTVSLTGRPTYASANAGSGVAVQQGSVALTGAEAGNYALTWTSGTGTIAKAALTVAATGDAKFITQSDTAGYNGVNYTGFVNGETSSVLGGTLAISRSNSGTNAAGSYSGVLVPAGLTADNYTFTYGSGDYTIVPANQLLIKASNASTSYGTSASYSIGSVAYYNGSSVLNLSQTDQSGNTFTYDDGNSGTATFTLAASAAANSTSGNLRVGNYATGGSSFSQTGSNFNGTPTYIGNLAVTPLAATLSASSVSKTYDGTTSLTGAAISVGNKLGSDDITASGSGAFDSKSASGSAAFTLSGLTLAGTDAANYVLSGTTLAGVGSISQKSLSSNYTGTSKVYDGTTAATVTGVSSDIMAGDSVGFSQTADFADKNVDTGKTINISSITLGGADADNYTLTSAMATTSADITALLLTVSYVADAKVYDGITTATVTGHSGGVLEGDTVSFSQSAVFGNKNAGTGKTINVTGIGLGGADAGNYSLQNSTSSTTADITAKTLTASYTGSNKTYDRTTTATVTGSSSDVISGDTVSFTQSASFADWNAGTGKSVSVTGITLGGADGGNYLLFDTTASASANITARSLTVSYTGANKTYDGATTATVISSVADVLGGDTVSASETANFSDKNVGTSKTINVTSIALSGADAGNYTSASTTATTSAYITAKNLTAAYTGTNKVYDGGITASVSGSSADKVSGDVLIYSQTAVFNNKNSGTGKIINVTGIGLGGADAGNYTLTGTTATTSADVTSANLAVTGVTADNKIYDATRTATLTGTAVVAALGSDVIALGGSGSGLFDSKNVSAGKSVAVTGYTITGTDAGNYNLIQPASLTADVTLATLYYAANRTTVTAGQQPAGYSGSVTGVIFGESLTEISTGMATWSTTSNLSSPSQFSIMGNGITLVSANYQLAQAAGNATALTVLPLPPTPPAPPMPPTPPVPPHESAPTPEPAPEHAPTPAPTPEPVPTEAGDAGTGGTVPATGTGDTGTGGADLTTGTGGTDADETDPVASALDSTPTPTMTPPPAFAPTPEVAESSSAAAKSSSAADASTSVGGASAGVNVSLVHQPSNVETGFVSVSVPNGTATEGVGFRVPLPVEVANVVNVGATPAATPTIEVRSVINGRPGPLPSWLRYLPEEKIFVATAVPDGGLPITIEIIVAGQRTLMVISERPN